MHKAFEFVNQFLPWAMRISDFQFLLFLPVHIIDQHKQTPGNYYGMAEIACC